MMQHDLLTKKQANRALKTLIDDLRRFCPDCKYGKEPCEAHR